MKNQITSKILKFAFAFMFILIASSCSQDDEAMDAAALAQDQINSEIAAKGAKVSTLSVVSAMVFNDPACVGVPHSFTINNDQTGPSNGINIQYEASPGVWLPLYQEAQAANAPTNFTFTFTAAGKYNLRYKMDGSTGFVTIGSITVSNCGSCTIVGEEFSGVAVSCSASREANFTFASENGVGYFKMQGGLTNFTGADAVVILYDADDNVISDGYTVTQVIQGGSSNRRITVEGALSECGSIRVNIKWDSTNSGGVITGDWSVKDGASPAVDYAAPVAGLECPN